MLYELTGVELRYGNHLALSIPSLCIRKGELVALLGPNGCGKTSLLKMLDGLIGPSGGSVLKEGKSLSKTGAEKPRSVYLHQYPYLLRGTVSYNIAFGCRAIGLPKEETKQRVAEALSLLGLSGMAKRSERALSGGEAQRVALARALASGADILLLDEPSASADAASLALITEALKSASKKGTTIVFSTHDEQFAQALAPRPVRMKAGKIEETGGIA